MGASERSLHPHPHSEHEVDRVCKVYWGEQKLGWQIYATGRLGAGESGQWGAVSAKAQKPERRGSSEQLGVAAMLVPTLPMGQL